MMWRGGNVRTSVRPGELTGTIASGRALSATGQHEQLTQAARKLVAQTFFGTMLKEMRNSPFKSELFSGGRGGEAFESMHDQYLAERMANGAGRRLAESVVKHLERRQAKSGPGTGTEARRHEGAKERN